MIPPLLVTASKLCGTGAKNLRDRAVGDLHAVHGDRADLFRFGPR